MQDRRYLCNSSTAQNYNIQGRLSIEARVRLKYGQFIINLFFNLSLNTLHLQLFAK